MSSSDFITSQNIETIWDVLLDVDGDFIMQNRGHLAHAIKSQFNSILHNFYKQEASTGNTLITMNKKIIGILVNEWIPLLKKQEKQIQQERNQEQHKESQNINLQNSTNSTNPILYTAEEMQQSRKNQFEKELSLKRNDFENAMAKPPPPIIDFTEKTDEPIGEMEKLIAETIAQRNFEINQLQQLPPANTSTTIPEKWMNEMKSSQPIKYIKIGEPLATEPKVIELNSQKKQLSWADDQTTDSNSIFSKLKSIPV